MLSQRGAAARARWASVAASPPMRNGAIAVVMHEQCHTPAQAWHETPQRTIAHCLLYLHRIRLRGATTLALHGFRVKVGPKPGRPCDTGGSARNEGDEYHPRTSLRRSRGGAPCPITRLSAVVLISVNVKRVSAAKPAVLPPMAALRCPHWRHDPCLAREGLAANSSK